MTAGRRSFGDVLEIASDIQVLKKAYIRSLPDKKLALNTLWQRLKLSGFDRVAAVELAQLAHKLTGSGGLYDFPAISHAAEKMEAELVAVLAENKMSADKEIRLEQRLTRLEQVLSSKIVHT